MKPITPQDAAKHLLSLRAAEESFLGYVKLMHPEFDLQPFHLELIEALDQLEKGQLLHPDTGKAITRLLINWPPRHGKSQIATQLFPAYYMGRNARRTVLSTSYGSDLAKRFGDKVREYVQRTEHTQCFDGFELRSDTRAKEDWATTEGGSYFGCGIGGGTTGRPANLLLIDDPIKNRAEAESATVRNKVGDFYISSLENRKEPLLTNGVNEPPIEVVILTRWHPDDLGGRIQSTDDWLEHRWMHITAPAIRRSRTNDPAKKIARNTLPTSHPMWVPNGELQIIASTKRYIYPSAETALWPDRFSISELKLKERRNPREFAALYQQEPYIKGGNLIKATWWQYADDDIQPQDEDFSSIIITADTSFKAADDNDPSVLMTLGLHNNGDIYILDITTGRWEFPELKRRSVAAAAKWRGLGLKGFYIEDRASGQSLIQELKRESGIPVIPYKLPGGDKYVRAKAQTPIIEGGRVFLPRQAQWLDAFIQQSIEFPSGTHDDMIDALTMGLDVLSRMDTHDTDLINGPLSMGQSLNAMFGAQQGQSLRAAFEGFRVGRPLGG